MFAAVRGFGRSLGLEGRRELSVSGRGLSENRYGFGLNAAAEHAEKQIVSRVSEGDVEGGLALLNDAFDRGLPLTGEGLWNDSLKLGFHEWLWGASISDSQKVGTLFRLNECGVLPCRQELFRAQAYLKSNGGAPLYRDWAGRWFQQMENFAVSMQGKRHPEIEINLQKGFWTLFGEFGLPNSGGALLGVGTGDVEAAGLGAWLRDFTASDVNPYTTSSPLAHSGLGEICFESVQSLSRVGRPFSVGLAHNVLSALAPENVHSMLMNPAAPVMVFSQDKWGATDLVLQKLDAIQAEIPDGLIPLFCDGPEGQDLFWVSDGFSEELSRRFPMAMASFLSPNFLGLSAYTDRIEMFHLIYQEIVKYQALAFEFRAFSQFVYDQSTHLVGLNGSRDGICVSDIQAGARLNLENAWFDLTSQQALSLGYSVDRWSDVSVRPISGDRVVLGGLFGRSLLDTSSVSELYGGRIPGEGGRVVHSMRALVMRAPMYPSSVISL